MSVFAARSAINFGRRPLLLKLCSRRNLHPELPVASTKPARCDKLEDKHRVDGETVALLERLSLVDFGSAEAVARLEEAVKFALPLMEVDTDGVEPLFTLLEEESLRLREDEVEETGGVAEALKNAVKTEGDYFVAPPGNIPLEVRQDKYDNKRRSKGSKALY